MRRYGVAVCPSLVHACARRCAGHIAGKQSQIKSLQCFNPEATSSICPSQIILYMPVRVHMYKLEWQGPAATHTQCVLIVWYLSSQSPQTQRKQVKIALRHFGDLMPSKYKPPQDQVLNQNQALNHKGGSSSSKTSSATPPPAPLAMPFTLREASYTCKSQWNSIDNSSSSTTCNPIYIAGTILQLQITMEFCRPHMHEKQLTPHLQCGTDPNMIRTWSDHIRPWSDHTRDRLAPVAPQR